MGEGGLVPVVVALLGRAGALTALKLLDLVRVLYEAAPRPKAFLARPALADQLTHLAADECSSHSVLVRKQAQRLLDAFRLNTVV